ncbi:hypothetical protein AB0O76_21625 [Streptomyces sp. NPDC086554]|uniref:LppU/SCO3897 family protein n=1 Tax=Streptomyces sp. NPDC086554 TaxID=3154864 RepID=UPI003449235C
MSEPIPPAPRPAAAPGSTARGCLAALGVVGAVLLVILLLNQGDGDDSTATPDPTTTTPTYSSDPYETDDPYGSDDPYDSATDPAATPTSPTTPTSEAPTPYDSGTCLNGTLPNSETAQEVSDVDEVSCSASDAHYRVIESIPMTSDLSACNDNSQTQYAFSSRYTLNGTTINEYVYCLVGIGSYAR